LRFFTITGEISMKFQLKSLAIVAAMVAAGSAHADLTTITANTSFAMVAFNTTTSSYYVRDLGYTLNTFLPSSVTTTATDGGGTAVTGDKTAEAGANITWGDTDGNFASWIAAQTSGSIVWTVAAGDASAAAGTANLSRAIVALSQTPISVVTNNTVRQGVVAAAGAAGLGGQNNPMGYSTSSLVTGLTVISAATTNNVFGAETLTALGSSAGLFYFTTTAGTGSSTVAASQVQYGNSAGFASLTLSNAGVLTYALAPAVVSSVPLPDTIWLMGAGLMAVGGLVRRNKLRAEA
jgi:hypothetical protein